MNNLRVEPTFDIDLPLEDSIVTAVVYHDDLIVITKRGRLFRVFEDTASPRTTDTVIRKGEPIVWKP